MSRCTSLAAAGIAVILACATPGYRVRVEARGIAREDRERILSGLESTAKSGGFTEIAQRSTDQYFPDVMVSSYTKRLSEKWRDYTSIDIHYFVSEGRVSVDIENALRGMEPPVKAEIDALGSSFQAEMSRAVGKEGVSIERRRTSIPLLY